MEDRILKTEFGEIVVSTDEYGNPELNSDEVCLWLFKPVFGMPHYFSEEFQDLVRVYKQVLKLDLIFESIRSGLDMDFVNIPEGRIYFSPQHNVIENVSKTEVINKLMSGDRGWDRIYYTEAAHRMNLMLEYNCSFEESAVLIM